MAYTVPKNQQEREALRLQLLAEFADPLTRRMLRSIGVADGWHCLEIGAGGGSVAAMLGELCAPSGTVLATDVELRNLGKQPHNVETRQHDVLKDPLPAKHFHLAHARGVLEHIAERDKCVANMVGALRPGGWLVVEDSDWIQFDDQPMPEEFATLVGTLRSNYAGFDSSWARRVPQVMQSLGLEGVRASGEVSTMHGGTPSCEWLLIALEWAAPGLVAQGLLEEATVQTALAQARDSSFCLLSPIKMSVCGRVPL